MKKSCKECKIIKELSDFYTHPQTLDGRVGRCKECVKAGRRSERERKMARINDKKRAKNPKRIAYITKNTRKYRKTNPKKWNAHKIVNNYFRYHLEEKPKQCSNCGSIKNIELHHEDYNKPRQIIPLCCLCHKQHHSGKINIDTTKVVFF